MKLFYHLLLSGLLFCLSSAIGAQPLTVTVTDATGNVGQQVCVDLVGDNFDRVSGMQFTINYDPNVLAFVSATGTLNGTQVSMIQPAFAPGQIRLQWSPFSTTGYTNFDPFVFGTICFTVSQQTETQIRITGDPIPVEFTNDRNEVIDDVMINNGTVNTGIGSGPNCMDGVMNGSETGVDCGGPDCAACPTCDDGIRNGSETGVDCGGPDCAACPPTCTDGIMNGNETGVDCGGPDCAACPTCDDGVRNGRETGVDCGGPDCAACPPTCTDGIMNGNETGVDCGGPDCAACPTCDDGIQNGNETGVDCGGSCAPCSTGGGGPNTNCGNGTSNLTLCLGDACDIAMNAPVCIDITAGNYTNITSFQTDIVFNTGQLFYQSITTAPALGEAIQVNVINASTLRLLYFQNSQTGVSVPNGTIIGTLCFTNQTAATTDLNFTEIVATTTAGQAPNPVGNGGAINDCGMTSTCTNGVQDGDETGIDCGGSCAACPTTDCGEGTTDVEFCVGSECADAGAEVCVPVFIGNFNSLGGLQMQFAYNAANLDYTRVIAAPALAGGTSPASPSDGRLNVVWNDGSGSGVNFPADVPAFELCFTVENATATPITFFDEATTLRAFNELGARQPSSGNPGAVNSNCGGAATCSDGVMNGDETGIDCGGSCAPCGTGGGPDLNCGMGTNNVSLCLGDYCNVAVGTEVCVDITAGNFTNVTAFQADIAFTGTQLTYQRNTTAAALGDDIQVSSPSPGVVRLLYFQQGQSGVTVADGTIIGTLCFTNNAANATILNFTELIFTGTAGELPNPVGNGGSINDCGMTDPCNNGVQDGSETGVDCGGPDCAACPTCDDGIQNGDETGVDCGGSCAPCTNGGGPDLSCGMGTNNASLCLGDYCNVAVGAEVCIEITAGNFTNVTAFQTDINFPANQLTYSRVTTAAALGDQIQVSTPGPGIARLLYFQQSQSGVTVPDGTIIGELCFTNNATDASVLSFSDLIFTGTGGQLSNPVGNGGTVNDCGPSVTPLTLNVGSGTAAVGDQVCVDVDATGFTDITALALALNYDPAVLMLSSVTANSALPGFGAGNFMTETAGTVGVSYSTNTPQTLAAGSPVFTICFTVRTEAETTISVGMPAATTTGGAAVPVNTTNGTINAGGVITYDNLSVVTGDANGAVGTEVCLDYSVYNFSGIAGMQYAITYDVEKLQFNSATASGALPGLQANTSAMEPGVISVIWFEPSLQEVTLEDATVVMTACFTVLQTCETTVAIEDTDRVGILATNAQGQALNPFDVFDGTVNAGNTGPNCDDITPPSNLVLELGSTDAALGQEVCLDLDVTSFASLTNLSFTLTYDAAAVSFARAANFGLGNITAANVSNPSPGVITFDWTAPGGSGQNLVDGSTLLSFCFTVDRVVRTNVGFSNTPLTISARNAAGQNVGLIPNGGVINPNAPQTDGLTFQIGSAQADVGETVCLPIIGYEVNDLTAFQYTINYPSDILEYTGQQGDFALSGSVFINNSPPGVLRNVWSDAAANGNTVPDGTAIYNICFRVLTDEPATISFGDAPTAIEFEDVNNIVMADLINGTINGGSSPSIIDMDLNDPSCAGFADGSINLTVSGAGSLTYLWSDNVSTTNVAENLSAGTYGVTITNQAGQSTTGSFTLEDPAELRLVADDFPNPSVTGVSCNGEADGSIAIVVAGGTEPYSYDWSGNLADNVSRQDDLDGGSYSVTVTDASGCSLDLPNIMVAEPGAILIGGTPVKIGSTTTGGVNVVVQGGRSPFTYAWSGPGNYASSQEDIDDVTVAGTYCLTVTDNSSCEKVQCFAVPRGIEYTVQVANGCTGENNGSISLTVSGGDGTFDYVWSNNGNTIATTRDIDNLSPGDYSVTITSGICENTATITIDPEPVEIEATVTPATNGNDGAITLSPSGGNPPLSFNWGDGSTEQNRTGLTTGEYCVSVIDESGCDREFCYTIFSAALAISGSSTQPTTCADTDDGTIRLELENGVGPYRIAVEPLGETFTVATSPVEVSVPAGTYTVTVTDGQGNRTSTDLTVASAAAIAAPGTATSDTEDAGCSGMISLDLSGGTGPYAISWSNGGTGQTLTQLCAGDYTATVTDDNGCTVTTETFTVGRIDETLDSITLVACETGDNGEIFVTISGGQAPYTYVWTRSGATDMVSTEEDLTGAMAGEYTLTVTDGTGATLVKNYTVDNTSGFSVTAEVTTDYGGFGASCSDAADARLEATVSGQATYFYEWTRAGTVVGTTAAIADQLPGEYQLIVSDDSGCEVVQSVTVTAPPAIEIEATITAISCGDSNDGSITAAATGGVGGFTFAWSTGSTTSRIQELSGGDYILTVTDANQCQTTQSFSIVTPEDLAVTFEATPADDGCNGSIQVLPLGGTGNFTYSWPQLPGQGDDPLAEGLCPGEYTIIVNDGCQTVTMIATVLDRRLPCLSAREVLTPNGDGLNESLIIFCSGDEVATDNNIEIYNRWGQLVYEVSDYDCSEEGGVNCFEGRTNDGALLPAGPYYFVFEFTTVMGPRMQQRGSFTIVRE